MTKIIDEAQAAVGELTLATLAAVRNLSEQALDDLKHLAETARKDDPSPGRRVAAFIVADCCGEVQKERATSVAATS